MEDIRIRYYSKTGNTKAVAEYLSKKLNVEAKEINDDDYDSPCGLLFLGGAPYANIMSSKLREYALNIKYEIMTVLWWVVVVIGFCCFYCVFFKSNFISYHLFFCITGLVKGNE